MKWKCSVCGYVYDPAENNNVPFENLPDDWVCPECGVGKDMFEKEEQRITVYGGCVFLSRKRSSAVSISIAQNTTCVSLWMNVDLC